MSAGVRIDLDLVVRYGHDEARLHARHELRGADVHAVASAGGRTEDRRYAAEHWRAELTRACRVRIPADAGPGPDPVALPWDLVVGTGLALAQHRTDLYDELVGRAAGTGVRESLRRLHAASGRLRAVGIAPGRARVGWVTWVLHGDGWRALTPYAAPGPTGPRPMLRLERRRPDDLVQEVARWVATAR